MGAGGPLPDQGTHLGVRGHDVEGHNPCYPLFMQTAADVEGGLPETDEAQDGRFDDCTHCISFKLKGPQLGSLIIGRHYWDCRGSSQD